ncbi:MAG: TauD/TfdA dioxygenase family protein [Lautropia sp.]
MGMAFHCIGRNGFAAEASGFDLRQAPTPDVRAAIEAALAEHGVVIFRDQPLDAKQQEAFIRAFGPPTDTPVKEIAGANRHFIDVGTVDDEGRPIACDNVRSVYLLANRLWHTDGSFNQPPVRLTALLARELPPQPPPTEYADMRSAWNALPPERQARLDGLMVEHSILRSREQIGMTAQSFSGETLARRPVTHPLVRVHPANGRKSLYLASHASHIVGRPLPEGRALLQELIAFATQPRFVYAHRWRLHDLVMWDDRWTMHRATPYDGPHPRKMRQCTVREIEPV